MKDMNIMRVGVKAIFSVAAGISGLLLIPAMANQAAAQEDGIYVPGRGFGTGIYIDGSRPVDRETRDKVDAYLEGYRRRQQAKLERSERLKRHNSFDLITRGRPEGRY